MSRGSFVHYFRSSLSIFFEYDTPRYVHIKSKRIGILSRTIELVILAYIIGFVLVWNHGYQKIGPVESTVVTKAKGYLFTNWSAVELNVPANTSQYYQRHWDSVDTIFPAAGEENGGFFVLTNVVITPGQRRTHCPEDSDIPGSNCTGDKDCEAEKELELGNGVQTGKCSTKGGTCEIYTWCPLERNVLPLNGSRALLEPTYNFTILIKNSISFPAFGSGEYKRRNILESANSTYLQTCAYSADKDPFCPIFRLGHVVEAAGENFSTVALRGGIFVIQIIWNCNLDWDFMEYCVPVYSFRRADNPSAQISPGWNFRLGNYYSESDGTEMRTLFKMYGVKVLIEVSGEGRKFNLIPLLLNVGSGLALMGLATILCDIIVLYCLRTGGRYKEKKYKTVHGDDAFLVNRRTSQSMIRETDGSGQRSQPQRRVDSYSRFTNTSENSSINGDGDTTIPVGLGQGNNQS